MESNATKTILIHHNNENRCADHKLISSLSCPVFATVFLCLVTAFQQRFCSIGCLPVVCDWLSFSNNVTES